MSTQNSDSGLTRATILLVSTLTVMSGATISPSLPAMQAHFSGVPNADFWVRLVLTVPALFIVWTANEVPDALRGRALGGLTTFMFLGQFLSPIASQPLRQGLGMTATYGLVGVALVVLAALLWVYRKKVCHAVNSTVGTAVESQNLSDTQQPLG